MRKQKSGEQTGTDAHGEIGAGLRSKLDSGEQQTIAWGAGGLQGWTAVPRLQRFQEAGREWGGLRDPKVATFVVGQLAKKGAQGRRMSGRGSRRGRKGVLYELACLYEKRWIWKHGAIQISKVEVQAAGQGKKKNMSTKTNKNNPGRLCNRGRHGNIGKSKSLQPWVLWPLTQRFAVFFIFFKPSSTGRDVHVAHSDIN